MSNLVMGYFEVQPEGTVKFYLNYNQEGLMDRREVDIKEYTEVMKDLQRYIDLQSSLDTTNNNIDEFMERLKRRGKK